MGFAHWSEREFLRSCEKSSIDQEAKISLTIMVLIDQLRSLLKPGAVPLKKSGVLLKKSDGPSEKVGWSF
jgi:hypothetical protein